MVLEKNDYKQVKNFAWTQAGIEFTKAFIIGGALCLIFLWFVVPASI